jgi:phosphatidylethanolamine/phosphatidyl-N-methylethanolamine N-methyltransferase
MDHQTKITQSRYNRLAPVYDLMEWVTERSAFQGWRRDLWSRLPPGRILEVGVGTGKNIPYYPEDAKVTAIDLSEGMLSRAKQRAEILGIDADLRLMDVRRLAFPKGTFDAAVATFVFCSVPLPVEGLQELGRAVKPGSELWFLEHVRIDKPVIGPLMDLANPLVVRMMGANINRQTVENVKRAGLTILEVEDLSGDLVKLIHARA